jgi:DNA-binding response OmpR family regulator
MPATPDPVSPDPAAPRPFGRLTPPQGVSVAPGMVATAPLDPETPHVLRVVVVDADARARAALAAAIVAAGHRVVAEAGDAAAGWAAIADARPDVVCVELDASADEAVTLVRRLRALLLPREPSLDEPVAGLPDEPHGLAPYVLAVVDAAHGPALLALLAAGADDYFTRPATPDQMAARLAIAARRMAQEAARVRAERALARAQWLAGIGETSIAIQHEINNPLAALLGHAALIEHGLVEPGEEHEILAVVVEQAHRIGAVIKRLAALRDPKTVEYLRGARMLDLSRADVRPE